jgi:hypothetical protein
MVKMNKNATKVKVLIRYNFFFNNDYDVYLHTDWYSLLLPVIELPSRGVVLRRKVKEGKV